ncbi:uncharacterized protein LOC123446269 isoform X1 [Hordeum vulgare subsp. vulgare]|uniref:uncharacterized protein LOC123446269 isoform X1 n=1 Tax=Hordeum vulgare subsp. vulgare TaxID=112509 RepID=UPI001D1A549D|nr:uncharacterized protein LOC123446269 isoform X1 [Hordeum vulgare subsp. vulgare]
MPHAGSGARRLPCRHRSSPLHPSVGSTTPTAVSPGFLSFGSSLLACCCCSDHLADLPAGHRPPSSHTPASPPRPPTRHLPFPPPQACCPPTTDYPETDSTVGYDYASDHQPFAAEQQDVGAREMTYPAVDDCYLDGASYLMEAADNQE